jgi:hypothetical protein
VTVVKVVVIQAVEAHALMIVQGHVHQVVPVIVTEAVIRVVIADVIPVVTAVVPVAARVIVTDNAPHAMVVPTAVVVMEHVQLAVIVAVMHVHMLVVSV